MEQDPNIPFNAHQITALQQLLEKDTSDATLRGITALLQREILGTTVVQCAPAVLEEAYKNLADTAQNYQNESGSPPRAQSQCLETLQMIETQARYTALRYFFSDREIDSMPEQQQKKTFLALCRLQDPSCPFQNQRKIALEAFAAVDLIKKEDYL